MENPAQYNITIRKGNDFEQLFEFQQDDGTSMNLTDWTVKSEIRQGKSRSAALVIAFTVYIPTPSNGKVYLRLTDTQTGALTPSGGYYDILLTAPTTNFDETYVEGICSIIETITEK